MNDLWLPRDVGVALVGYRGTGKTTVGRVVAGVLGRAFVDADEALETRMGRSIRSVFEQEGEPSFRDREEAMLVELTADPAGKVLSTGGGVVLRESNRGALRRFGHVVWLRADPAVLADRLRSDTARPALTRAGLLAEIADVLAAREPFYTEAADSVIDTDGLTIDQVAALVLGALKDFRRDQRTVVRGGD